MELTYTKRKGSVGLALDFGACVAALSTVLWLLLSWSQGYGGFARPASGIHALAIGVQLVAALGLALRWGWLRGRWAYVAAVAVGLALLWAVSAIWQRPSALGLLGEALNWLSTTVILTQFVVGALAVLLLTAWRYWQPPTGALRRVLRVTTMALLLGGCALAVSMLVSHPIVLYPLF